MKLLLGKILRNSGWCIFGLSFGEDNSIGLAISFIVAVLGAVIEDVALMENE